MIWVLWLILAIVGACASVFFALSTDDVRAIGDADFLTAVFGIVVVLLVSVPGFSLYSCTRFTETSGWHERWWRPTTLAAVSLLASVGAALWCGYLIAIRLAREWQI